MRDRRVLDLACGQGRIARELARRGALVVGVDISSALLEKARASESAQALGIVYELVDASSADALLNQSFDLIVCNFGLSDIDDLDAALATVARVLAAGGEFRFSILHPCFPGWGDNAPSSWPPAEAYFDEGWWQANNPGFRGKVGQSRHRQHCLQRRRRRSRPSRRTAPGPPHDHRRAAVHRPMPRQAITACARDWVRSCNHAKNALMFDRNTWQPRPGNRANGGKVENADNPTTMIATIPAAHIRRDRRRRGADLAAHTGQSSVSAPLSVRVNATLLRRPSRAPQRDRNHHTSVRASEAAETPCKSAVSLPSLPTIFAVDPPSGAR